MMFCAARAPRAKAAVVAAADSSSPVVCSQCCANPVCSGATAGPSIRTCMSRQWQDLGVARH